MSSIFPTDNSHLSAFDLTHRVAPERIGQDLRPLFGVANGIEDVEDPYDAADKALKYSKRFGASNLLCEFHAPTQKNTYSDNRFKGLEHRVAIAVEKAPEVAIRCCTPNCPNAAIKNSHSLQKGRILKYLAGESGKIYQTKNTPFSSGDGLKELSIGSASTFPGYCGKCEIEKFAASESSSISLSKKLLTPLIWRSLCFIRFRRAQEVKARGLMISRPELFGITKDHADPATVVSQAHAFKNSLYAYRASKRWVATFDRLLIRPAQPVEIVALEVPAIPFAGPGLIPIPVAFDGSLDSNLFKFYREISSLAYTTVLIGGVPFLIFCFRKSDQRAKNFCLNMMQMDSNLLSAYLPQIVIGGSDTVFVSKSFWEKEATYTDKTIFRQVQAMKFPEMTFPSFGSMSKVVVRNKIVLN